MSSDAKMQLNFKTKAGTLVNLYAQDEAELTEQLEVLGRLISTIDETEGLINAMETVAAAFSRNSTPAASGGAAPAATAPAGGAKTCGHGVMQYKEGVSASSGKPWKAYFCPAPKGDPTQCKAEWIR